METVIQFSSGGTITSVSTDGASFTITRRLDGIPGEVLCSIPSPGEKFIRACTSATGSAVCSITHGGVHMTAFSVSSAEWQAQSDTVTLRGAEGLAVWESGTVSLSFKAGTPAVDIARAVAAAPGLPVVFDPGAVLAKVPNTLVGRWKDAMTACFGKNWTVTPSGVICGGKGAGVDLDETTCYHVSGLGWSIDNEGSTRRTATVVCPLVQVDAGAVCSIRMPELSGSYVAVGVSMVVSPDSSSTTITLSEKP